MGDVVEMGMYREGYKLVLAYDTDHPEFARGFEMGKLWAELKDSKVPTVTGLFAMSNGEMLTRIADAAKRVVLIRTTAEPDWVHAEFTWPAKPPA